MKINIIKAEKDYIEIELDNLTVAELLRAELWNEKGISLAVWKREHPTKNPVLIVKGKNVKDLLLKTIERIQTEIKQLIKEAKKLAK